MKEQPMLTPWQHTCGQSWVDSEQAVGHWNPVCFVSSESITVRPTLCFENIGASPGTARGGQGPRGQRRKAPLQRALKTSRGCPAPASEQASEEFELNASRTASHMSHCIFL